MRVFWGEIKEAVTPSEIADIVEFVGSFQDFRNKTRCPVHTFMEASLSISDLYNCADNSLIRYDGTGYVYILHPMDLEACVVIFGVDDARVPKKMTYSEEVSLFFSYNSSTADVNERLVAQSLCEKGIFLQKFNATFRFSIGEELEACYMGYVRKIIGTNSAILPHGKSDLNKILHRGLFRKGVFKNKVLPAAIRKEYPDEFGSDLVAIFKTENLKNLKYIVFRVQVKLGLSQNPVDKKGATSIEKMKLH
jgi:hypothetical protein